LPFASGLTNIRFAMNFLLRQVPAVEDLDAHDVVNCPVTAFVARWNKTDKTVAAREQCAVYPVSDRYLAGTANGLA